MMNLLPIEVIERIILKCDGKTLLNIQKIDENWCQLIEYLTQKTEIWKWCVHEEIPKNELVEYCQKYSESPADYRKWQSIYQKWLVWQNLGDDINYEIYSTPIEMARISCMAVCGNHVALGSEDGRLKIYKTTWAMVHSSRRLAVKIKSLAFIDCGTKEKEILCILISHATGLLVSEINSFNNEIVIPDVVSHSVFGSYICYEQVVCRTTICKLVKLDDDHLQLKVIWYSRIYSPRCMNMWNGICTFLIDSVVKYIEYEKPEFTPMYDLKEKTFIDFKFTSQDNSYSCQSRRILRDDVVITIYKNDDQEKSDFIEFCFLDESNGYSTKLFNSSDVFLFNRITCIFVYGNTLIIGLDIGNIYMYHVSSWKNLNLRNYDKKLIIGRHPIISIEVKEEDDERRFYIASRFCVHQLTGYSLKYKNL
ncbi:unnamed protein product [Brassicogethes aeneus]|uniref:F-box domain-containing protein n=1 Tax=Brassicogethes aeneus TaxID=1431903 RepID=A0A9P0BCR5_BRAAE|nr:unnamed protein product [Brassicogethes aeneus]